MRLIALCCAGALLLLPMQDAASKPRGLAPIPPTPELPMKGFPGLNNEQIQSIIKHTAIVNECMATKAKEPVARLQKRRIANSRKIMVLCKAGKRKEAQAFALSEEISIAASDEMKVVEQCRSLIDNLIKERPELVAPDPNPPSPESIVPKDVCEYQVPESN